MRGKIDVKSQIGKGTTFSILISAQIQSNENLKSNISRDIKDHS